MCKRWNLSGIGSFGIWMPLVNFFAACCFFLFHKNVVSLLYCSYFFGLFVFKNLGWINLDLNTSCCCYLHALCAYLYISICFKFQIIKILVVSFTLCSLHCLIFSILLRSFNKWPNKIHDNHKNPTWNQYWFVYFSLFVIISLLSHFYNFSILICDDEWKIVFLVYHMYLTIIIFVWVWFCCFLFIFTYSDLWSFKVKTWKNNDVNSTLPLTFHGFST